jgi:hypothetical protein
MTRRSPPLFVIRISPFGRKASPQGTFIPVLIVSSTKDNFSDVITSISSGGVIFTKANEANSTRNNERERKYFMIGG